MENYQNLIKDIEIAREKAARFIKVDLHVHSHDSHDFPKLGDKENCVKELSDKDKKPIINDYVTAAKSIQDLSLVAITDHNRSRISAELAKRAIKDDDIVFLPGMEVTLQATIFPDSQVHILTIFPEHFSSEDIQAIFPPDCGMPEYDKRTKDSVAKIPVEEFIDRVHKAGGICIAGHVNSNKGVRNLFLDSNVKRLQTRIQKKELEARLQHDPNDVGLIEEYDELVGKIKNLEDGIQNGYLEFLSSYKFDAVEVQKSKDFQYYTGMHTDILGIQPIPCLLGSDSHNLQDIGLMDSTTFVKMTEPGFGDLKRALRDPGTRIRYEDSVKFTNFPRILGIHFNGGFFDNHILGISDNLTCLIGGRGTGKSAAIEALRNVFEHDLSHLEKEKRTDIDKRNEHTLKDSVIKVVIMDSNGEEYVLSQKYGEPTLCFDSYGNQLEDIKVSVSSNLAVKIYGWGEIEELARNKREQLKLLDGFIPESKIYRETIRDLRKNLERNTTQIVSLVGEIEGLLPSIAELPEKELALDRLCTEELDVIFKDFDRNEAAYSSLEVFRTEVDSFKQRLINEDGEIYDFANDIEQAIVLAKGTINGYSWANDLTSATLTISESIQTNYIDLLGKFDELIKNAEDRQSELNIERTNIELELSKHSQEAEDNDIEQDISSLIERRRKLTKEVSELRAIKNLIDDKQKQVEELVSQRYQTIVPALQSERRKFTSNRKRKIREINIRLANLSSVAKVSVDLLHQKEREEFRVSLGAPEPRMPDGILKGVSRWFKRDKYANLYSHRHSPHTFVKAILYPAERYSNLCACRYEDEIRYEVINEEKAEKVAKHLSPYLEDNQPHFNAEKFEKLLTLEHSDTEDLPMICLDDRPIEELSPGQRCCALIPIILLESNVPLIIDQPEDNLDNKLVFNLVVDIIRSLKEIRQIIVATHNPNIPVSGDSEHILVFDAQSRECCEVVHQGSIDDQMIVDQIKAIMEGSEEAFRIRAEKYGYRLDTY